jgi:hypothetical protein
VFAGGWTTFPAPICSNERLLASGVGTSASVAKPDGAQRLVPRNAPACIAAAVARRTATKPPGAKAEEAAEILAYPRVGHELARSGRVERLLFRPFLPLDERVLSAYFVEKVGN